MKILRDITIILIITFGALIFIEIALRMVFPDKVEKEINLNELAYVYNPNSIISLKPNITKDFKNSDVNGGQVITWKTNSLGYRGDEIGPKENYRIIVYGDSNVQARFSELKNTYPKKLENFLSRKIKKVEVINGGLVGAGPDQSLIRFIDDVDVIKPDLIILHIYADNDYGDIIRNRLFELSQSGDLVKTSLPVKRDQKISPAEPNVTNYLNSLFITRAIMKLLAPDESSLSREDKASNRLKIYEQECKLEYLNYENGAEMSTSHFADHYDFDLATNPDSDSAKVKVLLMKRTLERFKIESAKRNIKLVVVVQPSSIDTIMSGRLVSREELSNYNKYNYKNLTNPIKTICKALELYCVHLIDGFLINSPETLYLKNDNHWNNAGQELSAKLTTDYIVVNEIIK
ncbi:hypothetical protein MNBD_GAMMA12-3556 [hydrothermal vent metagenome]|uniref:AlgX/AlgJ SGNH hydrolase-like domain-containing protein n=1 Tax=hydrothermal vent metagenome TaxID=652676 RepID=A0A3B0YRQ0_9ZZZZ